MKKYIKTEYGWRYADQVKPPKKTHKKKVWPVWYIPQYIKLDGMWRHNPEYLANKQK